jgi:hypothetical protein
MMESAWCINARFPWHGTIATKPASICQSIFLWISPISRFCLASGRGSNMARKDFEYDVAIGYNLN